MSERIVLFWSKSPKENETFEDWVNTEISLTEFHRLPLESHMKFGHEVYLFTYQKLYVPEHLNVHVQNADKYYPAQSAYSSMMMGHSIAHISDYVRLMKAAEINGILMDMDNVVINEFPNVNGFSATMPAKTEGGMAIKFGKSHPPIKIHDGSWDGKALSCFPIKINKEIVPHIHSLCDEIDKTLMKHPSENKKGWNFIVWAIKDIIKKEPSLKVMKPIQFGPLPAWKGKGGCYSLESPTRLDGKTKLFGYTLPSIEQIMNESYVVQHFFESAFKGANETDSSFWNNVKKGSLLENELIHIMGENWRQKMNSESNTFDSFFI